MAEGVEVKTNNRVGPAVALDEEVIMDDGNAARVDLVTVVLRSITEHLWMNQTISYCSILLTSFTLHTTTQCPLHPSCTGHHHHVPERLGVFPVP